MWRFQHFQRYGGVTAQAGPSAKISSRMSNIAAVTALRLYLLRKELDRRNLFRAQWDRPPSGRLSGEETGDAQGRGLMPEENPRQASDGRCTNLGDAPRASESIATGKHVIAGLVTARVRPRAPSRAQVSHAQRRQS